MKRTLAAAALVAVSLFSLTATPSVADTVDRRNCDLQGTDGPDVIRGGKGIDVICGNGGDDVIFGGKRLDWLYGGHGDDVIYPGRGNDWGQGGPGNDRFYDSDRGEGKDLLHGGVGDDVFFSKDHRADGLTGDGGQDSACVGKKDGFSVENAKRHGSCTTGQPTRSEL